MSKTITFSALSGEIRSELDGVRLSSPGTVEDLSKESPASYFGVDGTIYDQELSTEFSFKKLFDNQKDARAYFDSIINKYPLSEIKIDQLSYQEIAIYS